MIGQRNSTPIALLQLLTSFLSTPLKDILFIKRTDIIKPHKIIQLHLLRRTLATSAIDKGMPIEQVQQLLGHQKIDTTMHYAMVKQQNVKLAHRKFIG